MTLELLLEAERQATPTLTGEVVDARVDGEVLLHARRVGRAFATLWACVRVAASVRVHVTFEVRFGRVRQATDRARPALALLLLVWREET